MNLICGINPVLEALAAGSRHFDRLLVVKGLRNKRVSEAIARAGQSGIPLRFEGRETLDRMAGGVPHQGVIAVVSPKPVIGLSELLDHAREPGLVVLLDGVEDPRNLGAILRTAEAAGVDGVLLPERHSAGLSETVSRASAGALDHVKVARIGNVSQALETLKARGFWTVGLDAGGSERWADVDYHRSIALVVGGEGRGMRRLVRERCDHVVSLPLFGHVGSLNVSVATGIALYEVIRQRGSVPSLVKPIPIRPAPPARVTGPNPDDGEGDPGAFPTGPAAGPSPEEGEGEREEGPSLSVVHLYEDEDAAWRVTTAPQAPRNHHDGERRPQGRPRGNDRGGDHRGGDQRAGDRGVERPGPREGGRRRRRRRPDGSRHAGQEGQNGPNVSAAVPVTEGAPGEDAPVAAGEPRGDRPPGRRGRRRRRRR